MYCFYIEGNTYFQKSDAAYDEIMELEKRVVRPLLPTGEISSKTVFLVEGFFVID